MGLFLCSLVSYCSNLKNNFSFIVISNIDTVAAFYEFKVISFG